MTQRKKIRRAISIMLVLCITVSMMPSAVFAGDTQKKHINYVSFGDSMTNGYGHDGYYEEWDESESIHHSVQVNGFRQNDVTTTYPAMLKDYLKTKGSDVNWEALAISCMRTEDVNFLLRYHIDDNAWNELAKKLDGSEGSTFGSSNVDNWKNGAKAAWESTFVDDGNIIGDYFTWNEFVQGRFRDWRDVEVDETNYPWSSNPTLAYARYYQNAVKNADVITLGTGNANFGVIMLQNITSLLTEQKDEEGNWNAAFGSGFRDAVPAREVLQRRMPAKILPTALDILDMIDEKVAIYLDSLGNVRDTEDSKATKVLEIVEYTTVSFMFSYMDMLYAIDDLNDKKNLDIIMMGLMNTMDGVKLNLGNEKIIDLGKIVDAVTDVLSTYYFVLPVALQDMKKDFKNITFYIAPNDDYVEMQVSDMTSLEKIKGSNTIRDRMIQEVSGMIFDLVRGEGTQENPGLNGALKAGLGNDAPQLPNWSMNDNTAYQYREKVEAYEALQQLYKEWVDGERKNAWTPPMYGATNELLQNPNNMLACAVYLAFERGIIANADNATLDLDGLMSLMGGTDGLAGMMTPIATSLTTALGQEAQTALTDKVTASVAAQLVATGKAQYNTDEIKTAIATQITALGDNEQTAELKTALDAIKDQALVPVKGEGTAWYNLSFTDEKAQDNMQSVGTTLSNFANSMDETKDNNVVATPTAMFTVIELTNALNGALGDALTSEDAASLGGLLSLFARMIIGNGIGSHPNATGHGTLYNEIMEVYPETKAKEQLIKMAGEDAWWIYKNFEEVTVIVDFAAEQGWLDSTQAQQINTLINNLAAFRDSGMIEEAIETAEKIGKILKTATGISIVALSTASITTTINKIVNKRKEKANKFVWDKDYTIDVAPTCTEAGMKSIHGSDGVSVKDAEIIPATGHDFGEWMLDAENKATAKRVCANCGCEESMKLTIKLTAKASEKKIALSWNSVIGAEKYVVYAAKSGGKLKKLSTVEAADKDGYKKTVKKVAGKKLVAGKKYKFYVKALDSNGKQIVKSATKQLKAA